jgi:mono/diheme cytochrome c family protein
MKPEKIPYKGDPNVLAEGKKFYDQWCQSCHMPDGNWDTSLLMIFLRDQRLGLSAGHEKFDVIDGHGALLLGLSVVRSIGTGALNQSVR